MTVNDLLAMNYIDLFTTIKELSDDELSALYKEGKQMPYIEVERLMAKLETEAMYRSDEYRALFEYPQARDREDYFEPRDDEQPPF